MSLHDFPSSALLLAASGSRLPGASQSLQCYARGLKALFPGWEICLAYTMEKARQAMRERGETASSPQDCLEQFAAQGIERIVVQSLHVIAGGEYEGLKNLVVGVAGAMKHISLVPPLLGSPETLPQTALCLSSLVPRRQIDEGILFIGHGSHHAGALAYPALQAAFVAHKVPCAIQLFPPEEQSWLDSALYALYEGGIRRLHVLPLLFSAGLHMKNDIEAHVASLKQGPLGEKFSFVIQPQALLEYPAVCELLAQRLRQQAETMEVVL